MQQKTRIFGILLIIIFLLPGHALGQGVSARISSPHQGEAVLGVVPVEGSTDVSGFDSYELAFAPSQEPETWFRITKSDTSIQEGILGEWDTTLISDGLYSLRLAVSLKDGSTQSILVKDIRVRNYSPVETNTPAPTGTQVPDATQLPTGTPIPPTPTTLPDNYLIMTTSDFQRSLLTGAVSAVILLVTLFILWKLLNEGTINRK
ncbi:MAG: hypothetical protein JXA19_05485 [Anaerolineales bacterium]|nr:hypothetical protein [Anaerolineales bacterium]